MAICPKCQAPLAMLAVRCDSCGFDFPQSDQPDPTQNKHRWEFSWFSDLTLLVSAYSCLFLSLWIAYWGVRTLFTGQLWDGALVLLTATVAYGLFIVFLRVR
jgi:hypothetical protein